MSKKYFWGILLLLVIFACSVFSVKSHNHYIIPEDTAPLVFMNINENTVQLYYLQDNKEVIETQMEINVSDGFDINREVILLKLYKDVMAKYNYKTNQFQKLGSYQNLETIVEMTRGDMDEFRFIPESNNVSFIIGDEIYMFDSQKEIYQKVYTYDRTCFLKLGFSYEWKNEKELYLIEDEDLILYNVETKDKEIILKDIGYVYFNMSDDRQYIIYQKQYGKEEERGIFLEKIDSGESKKIYTAKSDYKVITEFSPDAKYIFMVDHHADNHLGKQYFYLYDTDEENKYRLDLDDLNLGWFVGWD